MLPTRVRRRRKDWTPIFLAEIRAAGNVGAAAAAAGVHRSSPYIKAKRDTTFAAAWAEATEDAVDVLEAEARRRALDGSDGLLQFLLRAYRPSVFKDQLEVRVDVRREAERIAERLGVPVAQVLERYERTVREVAR